MLTTFDRFLFRQYFLAFATLFAAALGLFAVVDGFTNLDGFQKRDEGLAGMLWQMAQRYGYQSSMLFDMTAPFVSIMSMVVVLMLLLRHGELNPLLAAGVPCYRVCLPMLMGIIGANLLAAANQELLLPRVAPYLHGSHGDGQDASLSVQPRLDAQGMYIAGSELYLHDRRLTDAEFSLPRPQFASEYIAIRAKEATFLPAEGEYAAGWVMEADDLTTQIDLSRLTALGRQHVFVAQETGQVFIKTEVTVDQLASSVAGHRYISTFELLRRLQSPSGSTKAARAQLMHFHWRLTRVLVNVIGFFIVVPFVVRREHDKLAGNITMCMVALSVVYGLVICGYQLGQSGWVSPAAAVWGPLIISGAYCGWITPWVRT